MGRKEENRKRERERVREGEKERMTVRLTILSRHICLDIVSSLGSLKDQVSKDFT